MSDSADRRPSAHPHASPCTRITSNGLTLSSLACVSSSRRSSFVWERQFSGTDTSEDPKPDSSPPPSSSPIAYEAPFSSLALRLKRVSISSAVLSLIGVPLLVLSGGGGGAVPPSGQLAVGGTAVLAACGSTLALDYCFSPYVHSLEWITIRAPSCLADGGGGTTGGGDGGGAAVGKGAEHRLIKAVTRNLFALRVETVFDPVADVDNHNVAKKNNRPFCNFIAKGVPLYVHPNLVQDEDLRVLLVGQEKAGVGAANGGEGGAAGVTAGGIVEGDFGKQKNTKKKKDDDDDFL